MIIKPADHRTSDITILQRLLAAADAATAKRIEQEIRQIKAGWPAAGSVYTNLGSLSLLELDRTDIAQRRVSARRVVEPLDVVEHIRLDVITRSVDPARNPFGLH